ncbi:DivIVA domain-containing protein [Solirubrobacter phytolaccae]|uniref:DivIVA domain-containing protein n=1 Tax=Solirubrobacter phytolaccae TaxID=1404360 RepID=A0A9X3SCL5_9ACTN|nr:DivIVA domain-containing protein [Solirubrobacter phytolaccae]MDA0182675.1 DivIVA domain-containing protein [Solirubrobacter phytolaccae]
MDRDLIQRRDFPTGRRGYDPAAVDEHLRQVADAFAANSHPPAPTLASSTSEQVREILEAAERSVSQVRESAQREASDHVAQVQDATSGMLSKLDELESELGRLLSSLRASGERLSQGLEQLQADVAGASPPAANGAAPSSPAADAPSSPPAESAPAPVSSLPNDEAGARLIALNMALGGSPREETAAYLAEHFELADPEALLDDVYARAGR